MTGTDKLLQANQEAAEQHRIASLKEMKESLLQDISDEEIEKAADAFEFTNGIYGFKQGVKWCLKQLKQRQ